MGERQIGSRVAAVVKTVLAVGGVVVVSIASALDVAIAVTVLALVVLFVGYGVVDALGDVKRAINKQTDEQVTTDELRRRGGDT